MSDITYSVSVKILSGRQILLTYLYISFKLMRNKIINCSLRVKDYFCPGRSRDEGIMMLNIVPCISDLPVAGTAAIGIIVSVSVGVPPRVRTHRR